MRFPGSSMMDVALNTKGIFTCPPYFQRQTEKLLQNYWPTDIIIIKNVYIYIHIYVPSRNHRHFCGLFFFKALLIPSSLLSSAAWPILLSTGWNTRTLVSHRISYLYFIIIDQIIAVFKFSAKTLFRHEQFFQQWISNIRNVNEIMISVLQSFDDLQPTCCVMWGRRTWLLPPM